MTVFAQVAAEQLGVDVAKIDVVTGDTDLFHWGAGTFASRGAVVAGNAIHAASVKVRQKVLRLAAERFEVDEGDLELDGGEVRVKGTPSKAIPLGELALATRRTVEELADPSELARAAGTLLEECASGQLLVTLGNRGMSLFVRGGSGPLHVAAAGSEALDVSGAGDTAAAAFTLALAAGLDGARAMRLANAAAGVVVMEEGATACGLDKLRSAAASAPHPRAEPLRA